VDRLIPAIIALGVGAVLAVVLLVPFVAVSYRRRGGLTIGRTLAWLALLVWILGVQAYTLLPIPHGDYVCAGVEWNPWQAVLDVTDPVNMAGGILRNPAVQQLVLNVLLFVPWGVLVRLLWNRGFAVATASGFGISLLVELTQVTGVWGAFPCAYRLFDTSDLITNTVGALLGSLVAIPFARNRASRPLDPSRLTLTRRLVGMVCDVLLVVGITVAVGITANLVQLYLLGVDRTQLDQSATDAAGAIAAFVATGAYVLATGSTLGERAVRLRGVDGDRPVILWRLARFVTGIGGYQLLLFFGQQGGLTVFVIVTIILAWRSEQHRGLAHLASGMRLETS